MPPFLVNSAWRKVLVDIDDPYWLCPGPEMFQILDFLGQRIWNIYIYILRDLEDGTEV
jgi:hypothetical protein